MLIWTIYDHPPDFPNHYVAREWRVTFDDEQLTGQALAATRLETVRKDLSELGLVMFAPRAEEDHPSVVETWIVAAPG